MQIANVLTYLAALLAAVFLQRLKPLLAQGLSLVPRFWRPSLERMQMTYHLTLPEAVQLELLWSGDNKDAARRLIFEVIAYSKADGSWRATYVGMPRNAAALFGMQGPYQ